MIGKFLIKSWGKLGLAHGKSVHLGEIGNIRGKGLFKVHYSIQLLHVSIHRGRYLLPPKSHNIQSSSKHSFHEPKGNESFLTHFFLPEIARCRSIFQLLPFRTGRGSKMVARWITTCSRKDPGFIT